MKISSAAARPLPFLHRLQEGLRQGLHTALWALWATMKKYNISANLIQVTIYLCGKVTSAALFNRSIGDWVGTTVAVRQGCLYSHPPSLTIDFPGKDHDIYLRRSRRHCHHWRLSNHQSPLSWWHRWLSRRGRRTGKMCGVSRQSLRSLRLGDQCRKDQVNDKPHQRHQQG